MQGGTHHLGARDEATFKNLERLCAESRRFPDDQVGQFPDFDASYHMADTLCNGWVDGVFADVSLHSVIVSTSPIILIQMTPMDFVRMRCVPGTQNCFATSAHGLRIRRHHANSPKVVQNVFGSNCLCSNSRLGKGYILGNVFRQMMTGHSHIQVFVNCVRSKGARWVRTAGQNIWMLDQPYQVRSVATSSTFDMICVNGTPLERSCRLLYVASFVQRVAVKFTLNVVFFTNPVFVNKAAEKLRPRTYFRQLSMDEGVQPQSSCTFRPATPAFT